MILIINPSTKFSTPHSAHCFLENERSFDTKCLDVYMKTGVRIK